MADSSTSRPGEGRADGLEEHATQQSSYQPPVQPHPYHPTARTRSLRSPPPQQQQQQPRSFAPQSPPLQTQNLPEQQQHPRFSYTETPAHVQPRPVYTIVSATTINESPASAAPPRQVAPQERVAQTSQRVEEGGQHIDELPPLPQMPKTPPPAQQQEQQAGHHGAQQSPPVSTTATYSLYPKSKSSPERNGTSPQNGQPPFRSPQSSPPPPTQSPPLTRSPLYNAPQPGEVHPAHFAPYAEDAFPSTAPMPKKHKRQRTDSNGMPLQVLTSPVSPDQKPPLNANQQPESHAYPFPHSPPPIPESDAKPQSSSTPTTPTISTPRLAPRTPTYDPNSLTGPNVSVETSHLPGQISHPNAQQSPRWQAGLCAGDSLCFEALFCPCAVYGRTQFRIAQKKARREATDLLSYGWCNGSCVLYGAACGLQWLLALIQHTQVRKMYDIEGDGGSSVLKACCCCCCVLAQNEREIKERETLLQRNAGPAVGALPYVSPEGGMVYAPPPR